MKVLILNGSPKKKLGASWYISKVLKTMLPGCEKEEISLRDKRNYSKIFDLLGEIDVMVISVPLYVDGIPSHVLSFLQEAEAICAENQYNFKLYVISNNGFIEGKQNAVHLDMYRCWCERARVGWGGGLGIGGGVMLFVLLFVILAQIIILLVSIISNIVSKVSIVGTLLSFVPTIATWLFFNSGFLFCTFRITRAIKRNVTIKSQYTRVMLPSFIFLVVSDIFMVLMALFNGKLIFSLYHKDIEKAESYQKPSKSIWLKCGVAAVCLFLVAAGVYNLLKPSALEEPSGNHVLQWSEGFTAEDYFRFSEGDDQSSSASISDSAIPYSETRVFSDEREKWEQEGIIPIIDSHPLFVCEIHYYDDGSIYSVNISWHRRGDWDNYSDLRITAGYQEIEKIEDCLMIEVDEYGNVVTSTVTVTERDGIQIVAEGSRGSKTLTYQNDNCWFQVEGSWNDNYEDMVVLLDWIWEHPIDFDLFSMEAGVEYTWATLDEYPDAFAGYIPDFESFGFVEEYQSLRFKDGKPESFQANYVAHADAELVREGSYYNVEGWTNIQWYITWDPDYYELQSSLGELGELTEQEILDELEDGNVVSLTLDGYYIWIHTNSPDELLPILESLQ